MGSVLNYVAVGFVLLASSNLACSNAVAQDWVDHFKGEPAPTLEQALINIG